jgi:hypothetical protein
MTHHSNTIQLLKKILFYVKNIVMTNLEYGEKMGHGKKFQYQIKHSR